MEIPADGPLSWSGYADSRARATARTGEEESVVHGLGTVGGRPCVLISFEFGFLGGSLGQRTGDLLEAAYGTAFTRRLPLVSIVATGGSRMQEGMIALTQLQRVARASARLRAAGLPQLAIVRDPTTGGGWATLGAGADVILALPGAQIGFAGSRVRPVDADPAAYAAEGQLAAGQIDAVVHADELPRTLGRWLAALGAARVDESGVPAPVPGALAATGLPATGWDAVQQARSPARPRAGAYLDAYFDHLLPLSGDRCGGTDPGLLCGFGVRGGQADRVRRPVRHGDPPGRIPHRGPGDPARGPARRARTDSDRHPGGGERRRGGTGRLRGLPSPMRSRRSPRPGSR